MNGRNGHFPCLPRQTGATSFSTAVLTVDTALAVDPSGRTIPGVTLLAHFSHPISGLSKGGLLDFATARALGHSLIDLADVGEGKT